MPAAPRSVHRVAPDSDQLHRLRFDVPAGRALVFTGATRNSLVVLPLALSLGDAYAITGAVIVTQTLVEILGMVAYVRLAPRLLPDPPTTAPA